MDITGIEFARRNGLSRQWVCEMLRDGRIEGARKVGRIWMVPEDAVLPAHEPSGRVPSVDSAAYQRRQARMQRRADREAYKEAGVAGPKPASMAHLSSRELFVKSMRERGWKSVGRWIDADGEYFGPWWMEDETEEAFRVRDAEWLEWDKEGKPVELTPKDFAEWLESN